MPRPNFLRSGRKPAPLQVPQEPTITDHLLGRDDTPLPEATRHGLGVQAELARRYVEQNAAAAQARREQEEREREEADARWVAYCARVGRTVQPL